MDAKTMVVDGHNVEVRIARADGAVAEISWRETTDSTADEWPDVLREVCDVVSHLDRDIRDAWDAACEDGRGPDADRAIDGWRYVV